MAADMAHNLNAVIARGGANASSQQLRDYLAEGDKVSAVRYLAARDNARRYELALPKYSKSSMPSSRQRPPVSHLRVRQPGAQCSARCGH